MQCMGKGRSAATKPPAHENLNLRNQAPDPDTVFIDVIFFSLNGPLDVRDFFTCFGTALLEVYSNTVIIIVFLYRFRMASFVTGAVLTGVLRPALALMDTLQVCVRAFAHIVFLYAGWTFACCVLALLGMYA